MSCRVIAAGRVFTGSEWIPNGAVTIAGKHVVEVGQLARGSAIAVLPGDLVPGFVDIQVNGGGGVLFNDEPSVEALQTIGRAHRRGGTTAFMATVISSNRATATRSAIAVKQAVLAGDGTVVGLHLEGPWLQPTRRGIHDVRWLRPFDDEDEALILSLRPLPTIITVAPEMIGPATIKRLSDAGVRVMLGHSDATYEDVHAAFAAGACGFTHLFNAMSQLSSRAPGMVGAAIGSSESWASIIVDGHHVHPSALRLALAAKGTEKFMLVTDAVATAGTELRKTELGGKSINLINGRLTDDEGTLAGAHLLMSEAVHNATSMLEMKLEDALRLATANPATFLGLQHERGFLVEGARADLTLLNEGGGVTKTWVGGD